MSLPTSNDNPGHLFSSKISIEKTNTIQDFAQKAQSLAAEHRLQLIQQHRDNLTALMSEYENVRASFWWLSKHSQENGGLILAYIQTMRV
ncbi:MAG: hypothetical protein WCK35_30255, partial [Chloroflexota bacterium]